MLEHDTDRLPSLCLTGDAFGEDQVENPPINPVTGAERTSAMVKDQLRRYYNSIRESAVIKPIFLSDYLFFQLQGKGVQLGRVTRAPFGGAVLSSDTVDVTEYEHSPQDGIAGFFGTFKPRKNEHYNKQVRGSLQFIRHRDVTRSHVLVFNVQMFRTGESVRVCLKSLRELETASPLQHKLPPRLPVTHAKQRDENQQRPHQQNEQRRSANPRCIASANPDTNDAPLVKKHDRIQVYWTDEPVGWFSGVVTSSRKDGNVWVSRILYDSCDLWPNQHHAWHCLDPLADEHVTWRFASDN